MARPPRPTPARRRYWPWLVIAAAALGVFIVLGIGIVLLAALMLGAQTDAHAVTHRASYTGDKVRGP